MEGTENNKMQKDLLKKKLKNTVNFNISNIFCCIKCCSFITKKYKEFSSKISILFQFILFLIPTLLLISGLLILLELYFFDNILKFDYYTVIKEEFLRYFLTDLDDINFDLNQKKTSLLFEDISNLIFFKIYFEELNSYGLLDNNSEKIFSDISEMDENIYKSIELNNTIFSIPKNMSYRFIDSRNDSLSELAKLYYHFYPLIATETNSVNTPINQSYLIAYEVDENNKTVGDELYFNFPRITDDFIQNNNFFPYNNFISPRIEKTCENEILNDILSLSNTDEEEMLVEEEEEVREEVGEEGEEEGEEEGGKEKVEEEKRNGTVFNKNWFTFFDCIDRFQNNYDLYFNYFHLNENNRGSINKTNIVTLQSHLFNNENKKYIIDIIFFMGQKKLTTEAFEDSVFIVNKYIPNNKKYSDNQTYVISNNDITEIALSSQLDEYFHYGLSDENDNFYSEGVFYDNIDINKLYEPHEEYETIDGFYFDLRFFSSFYLYTKLFESSSYDEKYMETDHINYFIFNDSQIIYDICSKFDFSRYMNSLESNDVDCFTDRNLLYYSRDNINNFFSEGLTLPYCICLPLYCIKNLNKNFNSDELEFVDEIILPEKCQNNLLFYNNGIEEDIGDDKETIDITTIKLRMGETLNEQLEDQFIQFSFDKKNVSGGLSFIYISLINNHDMKYILIDFVQKLNRIESIFTFIIIFGTSVIFIFISILLILYIYSISKIIDEYNSKAYFYLKKLTDSANKNDKENNNNEQNILMRDKNNFETYPLLDKFSEEKNFEENELIEDLYKIYCKFYKVSENSLFGLLENIQNQKNVLKIKTLNESNELFKLFLKFALYIPRFKLDISLDYDFYKDSKLIQNFNKIFSKKTNTKEDKEQILYTKSIIKELLSTECVDDYGFITNLNFNYMTNINLNKKKENKNYIQIAMFKKVEEMAKNQNNENIFNNKEEFNIDNIKIVFKNKNLIMKKIEEKFEQDDYLNLSKLESYFNNTLINSFYNYAKKIIEDDKNT